MLIGVVALFAFGPEDIPRIMYNAGKLLRRVRYMRYALTNQFENFMDDIEQKSAKTNSPQNSKADTAAQEAPHINAPATPDDEELYDEALADEYVLDDLPEIEPESRTITEADLADDQPDQTNPTT